MEVLTRPSLPTRSSSLFDSSRTLFWPGSGPVPVSPISGFGPQAPPSPPYEARAKSNQLPPISDLLAYSGAASKSRQQMPPSPSAASSCSPFGQGMAPPVQRHEGPRIDPALVGEAHSRHSSTASSTAQRPLVDTTYPQYSYAPSTSTPYPHSAPGAPTRSSYGEVSPRSAISTASGPYYSASSQYRFAPSLTTPSSQQQHHQQHIPSISSEDSRRPPLSPYQTVESRQRPRGSFHPYTPQSTYSRPSHSAESPESETAAQAGGHRLSTGRNYTCPSCAKEFSRPSSLKIHEHSHSGAKPFLCPRAGCGKSFSVRSNMKRHERGCHTGQQGQSPEETVQGHQQ